MTAQVLSWSIEDSLAAWRVLWMNGVSFLNQHSRDDRRGDIRRQSAGLHGDLKGRDGESAREVPDYLDFCP